MVEKVIRNKRLPLYLIPIRSAYRAVKLLLISRRPKLRQIRIGNISFLVWMNEDIGVKMFLTRKYEDEEIRALRRLVRRGDVCIDVGGNIGFYSLNLALMCGPGVVHVFEILQKNCHVIELAAEINRITNIRVHPVGLAANDGVASVTVPGGDAAYAHLSMEGNFPESGEGQKVDTIPLDKFVMTNSIERVDIVKIDVEGAEMLVLEGATMTIERLHPRVIMVELVNAYLGRYGSSVESVIDFMGSRGYRPFRAVGEGMLLPYTDSDVDQIYNVFFLKGQMKRAHRGYKGT